MRVAHVVRSLANRVSPSPPPHVSPRPLPLSKSSLRYAFPAASDLWGEHSYSNPPSTEHSPLMLPFAIAGMSLLVSSSAARVSCQPDSLPPDAKSPSKSGHSSTLRQFLDNRPQLPRSDVSPSRNLSHAVMASGLIPRDSQCLPASPYPTQSNRKRKLSYLTTMDNLCNVIESQKHWGNRRRANAEEKVDGRWNTAGSGASTMASDLLCVGCAHNKKHGVALNDWSDCETKRLEMNHEAKMAISRAIEDDEGMADRSHPGCYRHILTSRRRRSKCSGVAMIRSDVAVIRSDRCDVPGGISLGVEHENDAAVAHLRPGYRSRSTPGPIAVKIDDDEDVEVDDDVTPLFY
ncbi:hypothetical protein THAOC_17386 [Thalassiosira oceanica]|uniref:Uncharacterized protein n=1 Tax=Thalassiosira oceanica TaxID=159749 RepID=K0SM61_THAOC|nr:hypothetical protein THAOC_17386 [Thalassiosira oceanica]|eukprot:EJK62021.1 hypothetical protein THAOC_17386 [Thalassiosira oceanica]